MHRLKLVFPLTLIVVFAVAIGVVAADKKKTVAEILDMVDANLTKVADTTYTASVSVIRNGKRIKNMEFEVLLKGLVMKKVVFTAPGDVRGMSVLTTSDGLMYVYMPSYKRVRRVAANVRNQGFMGTDVSAEEMGAAALSKGWHARLVSEDDKAWILKLTPEKETETVYKYMLVTVSKKWAGVSRIESYSKEGKLVKTQERSEWKTFGKITLPTKFVYTDHNTGSKTELRLHGCKVNTGIPDSAFTKRALMRGQ